MIKKTVFTLGLVLVLATGFAEPEEGSEDERRGGKHRYPPQEAFDACADKVESDTCTVETPRGDTLNGTCGIPPRIEELVCVPERRRRQKELSSF